MTNYIVTDSQMISLADAIREKGGTSSSLTFPTGMISAISDISTGGDLGFNFSSYYTSKLEYISTTENIFGNSIGFSGSTTTTMFRFVNQYSLSEVYIDKITRLNSMAFYNCWSLQKVMMPSLTRIVGSQVFYQCSSMTELYAPQLSYIYGSSAFSYCNNISSITTSKYCDIVHSAAMNIGALSAVFPIEQEGEIKYYARGIPNNPNTVSFQSINCICGNMQGKTGASWVSVNIPNLEYICNYGIQNWYSLTYLSLPKLVSMSEFGIYNCSKLQTLNCPVATNINIGTLSSLTTLNCPSANIIRVTDCPSLASITNSVATEVFLQTVGFSSLTSDMFTNASYIHITGSKLTYIYNTNATSIGQLFGNYSQNLSSKYLYLPNLSQITTTGVGWGYIERVKNLAEIDLHNLQFLSGGGNIALFSNCSNCMRLDLPKLSSNTGVRVLIQCYNFYSISFRDLSVFNSNMIWYANNTMTVILNNTSQVVIGDYNLSSMMPTLYDSAPMGRFGSVYVPDAFLSDYKVASYWSQYSDRIMPISSLPIAFMVGSSYRQAFPTSITWSDWLSTEFASAYGYYESNGSIFTSDGMQYISGINTSDLIVEDYEYELANV